MRMEYQDRQNDQGWSARLAGRAGIVARPSRVRLVDSGLVAAFFKDGEADGLPVPGAAWVLENGCRSLLIRTLVVRRRAPGGILVLAG
ncbi:MAG TPA: hypothetical protein PLV86_07040 [Candidatus Fermentibacter daniensis]|nr:hypothetical protein [Candidatus Fermentibacter daniensis]HOD18644.1 hypothetical protein [Candidatus Fermentibacter daniensis]HOG54852.1 hypothetical protein [Candidatus Fermentibacter daniensis]HQM41496.1 hypothetical protein [Candidatus Fermentibacter daniensis]